MGTHAALVEAHGPRHGAAQASDPGVLSQDAPCLGALDVQQLLAHNVHHLRNRERMRSFFSLALECH